MQAMIYVSVRLKLFFFFFFVTSQATASMTMLCHSTAEKLCIDTYGTLLQLRINHTVCNITFASWTLTQFIGERKRQKLTFTYYILN